MVTFFIKKTALSFAFISLWSFQIYSQMGCTDPLANNYDSSATQNDGSCTYDDANVSPTNSFVLDDVLSETSGLIYWNEKLWTQNDNSDTNIYELNPTDGAIEHSISLASQINKDWEEISQDENYVYLGDFGNNVNGNRTDLRIIRVSKSSLLSGDPEIDHIDFAYEDQSDFTAKGANNTNYDCEAFIVTDTEIFLFTKQWVNNKTRVYKLPKTPETYQAALQDSYDIDGLVTGAVHKKDEGLIALSGYSNLMQPFIFLLYDFIEDDFFGGNKRKLGLNLTFHQVEGITTEDGLNYFVTNEKFEATGTSQKLHTVDLGPYLDSYLNVASIDKGMQFELYPNPTTSVFKVKAKQELFPIEYIIFDTAGRRMKQGKLRLQEPSIDISQLSSGIYILKLGDKTLKSYKVIKK